MPLAMTSLILWALVASASGHGMMDSPQPRAGTNVAGNNKGNGRGPCGAGTQLNTQGASVATYTAGQTVDVAIRTTIRHGGVCRIGITEQGTGTPTAVDARGRLDATQNGVYDLTGDFDCAAANGIETKSVTIPAAASCANGCVLQWFWDGDSDYFDCADVTINAAQVATPAPVVPTPAPTPAPGPAPNPGVPVPSPTPAPNPGVPGVNPAPNPSPTEVCSEEQEAAGLCTPANNNDNLPGNPQSQTTAKPYGSGSWGGGGQSMGVVAGAHWTHISMLLLVFVTALGFLRK